MEFIVDILSTTKCDPTLIPIVSIGTDSSFIKINETEFELDEKRARKFVESLNSKRYTLWKYSLHREEAEKSTSFSTNWTLLLSFMGAVIVFHAFGRKQGEAAYNTVSVCLLNVFRLSLGQPLRKDPKRWSMKLVLLSWVLFQMHASIIYQGVLMTYEKSYESHNTEILVIHNRCLVPFQRLFETGLLFKASRQRGVTTTLTAPSPTDLLLRVTVVGWTASALVLLAEIWTHKNSQECLKWLRHLDKILAGIGQRATEPKTTGHAV